MFAGTHKPEEQQLKFRYAREIHSGARSVCKASNPLAHEANQVRISMLQVNAAHEHGDGLQGRLSAADGEQFWIHRLTAT